MTPERRLWQRHSSPTDWYDPSGICSFWRERRIQFEAGAVVVGAAIEVDTATVVAVGATGAAPDVAPGSVASVAVTTGRLERSAGAMIV